MFTRSLIAAFTAASVALGAALPESYNTTAFAKRAVTTINTCTVSGQVAITFDDGPYIYNTDIRNTLASAGSSKATFFLNGNNWDCIYDRADDLKALYAASHTMGSHGWSHADMSQLTWDQVHDELWRVEQAMIKILGVKPLYFRPPYGLISDTLLAALENRGYKKVFLWSEDSGDSVGASVAQSKAVYDQIAATYPQPHIVLNHETYDTTAHQVLPYAVSTLRNKGYKLVSVDTCLGSGGEWPYVYVGPPQARDSTWVC